MIEKESRIETRSEISVEQYESLLTIRLTDITKNDFIEGRWFAFSVTPEMTIYITDRNHEFLFGSYGVDLDTTLTEGYVKIEADGETDISLKPDTYQKISQWQSLGRELSNFKQAVENKIAKFVKNEQQRNTKQAD